MITLLAIGMLLLQKIRNLLLFPVLLLLLAGLSVVIFVVPVCCRIIAEMAYKKNLFAREYVKQKLMGGNG
jgi:hypothetical protein